MKKIIAVILMILLLAVGIVACADPITIDLSEMTPSELLELKDKIEQEYSKATKFDGKYESQLTEELKQTFEGMFTDVQSFSYPWLGFSTSRARTLYKLSGNCTVKYYDKSKNSYSVSAYFWHDEKANRFTLALLMLDKDISYKDDDALEQIIPFIDRATYNLISPYLD